MAIAITEGTEIDLQIAAVCPSVLITLIAVIKKNILNIFSKAECYEIRAE